MKSVKSSPTHLLTKSGEELQKKSPACPWNHYPRPQFRRDSFLCLNGEWEFSAEGVMEDGRILVPYPPESLLSGICRDMGESPKLRYRKRFSLPAGFVKDRVLLHFGAVDQIATVRLNGRVIGSHRGGYHAFSLDVTDALAEENLLEVLVEDHLEDGILPWGKQRRRRGGMWYTPVSGIWQTVWMESLPKDPIPPFKIRVDLTSAEIFAPGVEQGSLTVQTPEGTLSFSMEQGYARMEIPQPRLWSPEDPYLYHFSLTTATDEVHSYFALRTVECKTVNGIPRICLNGKPYFFHGLLDQGYFSDGIYTPASPECYGEEILAMKNLGFNMLRKHIKVEPEQFYYDCDRYGMIVFQDMVNNGRYSFLRDTALPTVGLQRLSDKRLHRDPATRAAFIEGMERTVEQLYNHPCICYWTIFNEGWGQFEGSEQYRHLRALDSSRVIDTASGWFSGVESDVESRHVYFKPFRWKDAPRPVVLSEFGGYAYKTAGHVFQPDKEYGYRHFEDRREYEDALVTLYEQEILPAIPKGLCAAVYTQVSDVEDETNGLLTYDRKVCKVTPYTMQRLAQKLYEQMK
ncbi:MAG: glycoside hydrolase family 2 [Clostridia bacterium]|nr:glycoside hydrolase family 2 [Clostridia bacterium]